MNKTLKCQICNKNDDKGIILLNKYICRSCELNLTDVLLDEFNYERVKRVIKHIWVGAR